VFKYVIDKGITSEELYPSTGIIGICKPFTPIFNISKYTIVPRKDINALQNALT